MKVLTFIVLSTVMMISQTPEASGNTILGSFSGSGSSSFGSGGSQVRYTNNNGIVEKIETHTNFEQKPDGSCIMRVVEVINGVRSENIIPISCEQAKEEVRKHQEQTSQEIDAHHQQMMREHNSITDKINKQIAAMQQNMFSF